MATRGKQIVVYASDAEHDRLERAAAEDGVSLSRYLLLAGLAALRRRRDNRGAALARAESMTPERRSAVAKAAARARWAKPQRKSEGEKK